jgi:hypothetical protein
MASPAASSAALLIRSPVESLSRDLDRAFSLADKLFWVTNELIL